ncbi:MAG: hypothetical protein JO257_22040 [Deltaproteobacteria bacterium]|nr:hypothetical protein [Deltaproteobacteria bacterium]
MLRKASVIATLIAAATATASADRWHDRYDRHDHDRDAYDRDSDRDGRVDEGPRFHRIHVDTYRGGERNRDLVAQYREPFDTRDGRGPVVVDLGGGIPLHKLILDSTGNSEVFNIVLQYADGGSDTFQWNHLFNAATADGQAGRQLVMGGNGRVVRRVLINGYNAPRTQLSVRVQ